VCSFVSRWSWVIGDKVKLKHFPGLGADNDEGVASGQKLIELSSGGGE